MFFGRKIEIGELENTFKTPGSELVVIYGRRRVGKSSLVKTFAENKEYFYEFEAVEGGNTQDQITHFIMTLLKQIDDPFLKNMSFTSWEEVFTYLTEKVVKRGSRKKKLILFFDEIQWMASTRSLLISLIKYYWDNHWKQNHIMLVLCGSIASFMIKKVVNSKALYGRIGLEINLKSLKPDEAVLFFPKRKSKEEILKYFLVFGTIPKYLEILQKNKPFDFNINSLCFSPHGVMFNELDRIFYNQFRESQVYLEIVRLAEKGLTNLENISKKIGIPSGGGLKRYVSNLEMAEILKAYIPYNKKLNSKTIKYSLSDEFLNFNFKFIEPNKRIIKESSTKNLFENISKDNLKVWFGFAFEKFCIKHSDYLACKMGFADKVKIASPYFERGDNNFQIDLVYLRFDNVLTVCEIKYHNKKINRSIIPDVERKIKLLKIPKGFSVDTALISLYGPDKSLEESGFFNYYVTLDDIIFNQQ